MVEYEEKRPSEVPIVVLDTETTGLHPGLGHRVVELAAVRLQNWQVTGEMNVLLQPERPMDRQASAVNGIVDADLVGKPLFAEVADQFLSLIDGALLVAHNAPFDANFLAMELYISGRYSAEARNQPMTLNPWLCTLLLARKYFYFGRNNLNHVARKLGVRIGKAHRALNDVYMTSEILKRMVRELAKNRLRTVGDLLYAQGGPIYMPAVPTFALPPIIATAFSQKTPLKIIYLSKSGETERVIEPKYPAIHQGTTYLVAHCRLCNEQRTFRLDRVFSAEPVGR